MPLALILLHNIAVHALALPTAMPTPPHPHVHHAALQLRDLDATQSDTSTSPYPQPVGPQNFNTSSYHAWLAILVIFTILTIAWPIAAFSSVWIRVCLGRQDKKKAKKAQDKEFELRDAYRRMSDLAFPEPATLPLERA